MCESRRIVKNRQSKTTTLQSMIENSAKKVVMSPWKLKII